MHLKLIIADLIKTSKENEECRILGQLKLILHTLEDDSLHDKDLEKDEEETNPEELEEMDNYIEIFEPFEEGDVGDIKLDLDEDFQGEEDFLA